MKWHKEISFFILALSIVIINRAYIYFPETSVDWFAFTNIKQSVQYYIYDSAPNLIIIILSIYISTITNSIYIKRMSIKISIYFFFAIMFYWLLRKSISTVGIFIPFTDYEIGVYHIYIIDIIGYTIYYLTFKTNGNED